VPVHERWSGAVRVVGFYEVENTLCVPRSKQAANIVIVSLQFQTIDLPLFELLHRGDGVRLQQRKAVVVEEIVQAAPFLAI
jgi:hypothetical protein